MSDEEKKAIKLLKDEIEKCKNLTTRNQPMSDIVYEIIKEKTAIKCVVNLVENQQREIEELHKEINQRIKLKIENEKCVDKDFVYKGKIREKLDKYRKKLEQLHSQELWNEPEDSIKDFKYNHYLEAYKELLEEK